MSKGSNRRPTNQEAYSNGYDRIFGQPKIEPRLIDPVFRDEFLKRKLTEACLHEINGRAPTEQEITDYLPQMIFTKQSKEEPKQ